MKLLINYYNKQIKKINLNKNKKIKKMNFL